MDISTPTRSDGPQATRTLTNGWIVDDESETVTVDPSEGWCSCGHPAAVHMVPDGGEHRACFALGCACEHLRAMTDPGHCEECDRMLMHVVGERAGGMVCPDCDHEFVAEIGVHLSYCRCDTCEMERDEALREAREMSEARSAGFRVLSGEEVIDFFSGRSEDE